MSDRLGAIWRTATSAPWRRAPILLARRPGVLAAVAGACAVMVAAVASVPLFLSSAGTASIALQAEERCPRDTGVTLLAQSTPDELRTPTPDPFTPLDGRLTEVNRWARLQLVALGSGTAEPEQVTVLMRDDATEHVDVLEGGEPGAEGIWITDRAAEATGLQVGDQAEVAGVSAPVAAIYRDVAGNSVDRFWCSNADLLLVEARGGDLVLPPPLVLVDRPTFVAVMESVGVASTFSLTEAALGADLTITEADDLVHELACHGGDAGELAWCSDGQPLVPRRQGGFRRAPMPATGDADFVTRYFRSALPFVTERSRAIQTSVGSGIWPVAAFAALAGVGLVAAAASLWFDRRRREVVLLSVRGVSPAGLGAKAVLELSGALLAGAVAGVALAYGLVGWLGPGDAMEPVAVRRAAAGAAVALVGAALTVAAVVVGRIRTTQATNVRRARRLPLAAVPWELGLVAVTVVSYRRLGEWGVPVGRGADVSRVDVLGLLFPVLFLVSVVAVVSRLLALGLRPLRAVSRGWPAALYLAVRRVARARTAVLGLVAASAVAVGVLAYAATMDRSLQTTLEAKAATFVGSDVAVRLPTGIAIPDTVADRATEVQVHSRGYVEAGDREEVTVLAIDPDTFGDIAFWDDTFADSSLDGVLARLAEPGDPTPAVVLGVDGDGPMELGVGDGFVHRMQIDPIDGVHAFPGMKRGKATVFVAADALAGAEVGGVRTEAWIEGDHDEAIDDLRAGGVPFEEIRRSSDVADKSSFVTVQWTFGFMRSLGLSAGVLAIGGVAVHLDARRRDRVLGHAFLRRMGLSAAQHRRALLAELVATVLVGSAVGIVAALVEAWLAHGRIDPVPGFDPSPLLRPATGVILASAVVAVVVVVAAAVLAQRRAERDDPVEVLRAGA